MTVAAFRPVEGAEPIPGFRLESVLGKGGIGEVWRAAAPGGFPVALKFLAVDQDGAERELRSLQMLQHIRDGHLLSIQGVWQVPGFFVLAMRLADGTLMDRLAHCRRQGLSGMPPDELLRYFEQASAGLDFLNEPRHILEPGGTPVGIQHADVKPQNLLLVGSLCKVGDFGLLRKLNSSSQKTHSLTAAYAPPEVFEGKPSRASDQYSLAVTWCYLRGGRLPFEGGPAQLMYAHVLTPPDLTMLPPPERPATARALEKDPAKRWPSCAAFVEALRAVKPASQPAVPILPVRTRSLTAPDPTPTVMHDPAPPTVSPPPPQPATPTGVQAPKRAGSAPVDEAGRSVGGPDEAARFVHGNTTELAQQQVSAPPTVSPPPPQPAPPASPAAPAEKPPPAPSRRGRVLRWTALGVLLTAGAALAFLWLTRWSKDRTGDPARPGATRPGDLARGRTGRNGGPPGDQEGSGPKVQGSGERKPPKAVPPPQKGQKFTNALDMQFAWIAPGDFLMGSPDGRQPPGLPAEEGRSDNERPHRVTLTRGYHLGVHLVTQYEWEQILGSENNRSKFLGKDDAEKKRLPVDNVSWDDCQEFCKRLSAWEKRKYRLPTEAEWEFACRAGTRTAFWFGETISTEQANYDGKYTYGTGGRVGEYRARTTPVNSFPANAWGLHDMHGNLWQWCQDWYGPYREEDQTDPLRLEKSPIEARVLRGGSWSTSPKFCRSAYRYWLAPDRRADNSGCRIVLSLD